MNPAPWQKKNYVYMLSIDITITSPLNFAERWVEKGAG
jgi:hypothetical protein